MRQTSHIMVRHPYVNEVPEELLRGFEAFRIDPEWQWVMIVDGEVRAQMLCANAHGLLFIVRLTSLGELPQGWLVRFLREVLAQAKEADCLGYATFLDDRTAVEQKLMRIVQRSGGMLMPATGAWAFGSTEVRY